jgi:hypothetical protein
MLRRRKPLPLAKGLDVHLASLAAVSEKMVRR